MAKNIAEGKAEMIPTTLCNTGFVELSDVEIAAMLQMSETEIAALLGKA